MLALLNNQPMADCREAVFNRVNFTYLILAEKKFLGKQNPLDFKAYIKLFRGDFGICAYLMRTAFVFVTSPWPVIDIVSGKVPSELKLSIPNLQVTLFPFFEALAVSAC